MASEVECSQVDCLPPIPSGYYNIVNKVNGNINNPPNPSEIPVVANPSALVWRIEHIKNHDYHIIARHSDFENYSAFERNNLLYVGTLFRPEVWVICGEYDATSREEIYIIKKFTGPPPPEPPLMTKAWVLENSAPGTQVQVIPPPFSPGPGCEVNRVPEEYTWFIRKAPKPTAATQTA